MTDYMLSKTLRGRKNEAAPRDPFPSRRKAEVGAEALPIEIHISRNKGTQFSG